MDRIRNVYQRLKNDKSGKKQVLIFLFIFAKEVLDCTFDWLFFSGTVLVRGWLTFWILLNIILSIRGLFSVIGTIVSGIDITSKFRKVVTGVSVGKVSFTDLCVLYIEDIPQLLIGLAVVLCRRETSIWTILKQLVSFLYPVASLKNTQIQFINLRERETTVIN